MWSVIENSDYFNDNNFNDDDLFIHATTHTKTIRILPNTRDKLLYGNAYRSIFARRCYLLNTELKKLLTTKYKFSCFLFIKKICVVNTFLSLHFVIFVFVCCIYALTIRFKCRLYYHNILIIIIF